MEEVIFQLRTQRPILDTSEPRHYPLSLDEKIREIEQFARTEKTLSQSLGNIERYFSTPQAGLHTGTPNCDRCAQKKRQIWEAYCEYYLGREPDRWDSRLHAYREEMHQMLNSIPAKYSLEDVHRRFEQELRDDLQRDMSGTQPDLGKMGLTELKDLRARRLEQHHTSADTEVDAPTIHSEEAIAFMTALQASKTSKERIQVYVKYYCTPSWSDTPAQKAIKAKYARLFERGFSHDVVLAKWKAEALESHDREISKQRHRLAELKMAQSAHLRSKAKRAEKDQRMQDREYVFVQKPTATCSLEGCEQEISLGEGEEVVECAVCLWLAGKDRSEGRRHSYYCSEAHLEEDFESHDRDKHTCTMSNYCIYHPEPGPEDTGQGGICPDCMDHGIINYFCSQDCYRSNIESHCEMIHYSRDIQERTDFLEVFRPDPGLDTVSPKS